MIFHMTQLISVAFIEKQKYAVFLDWDNYSVFYLKNILLSIRSCNSSIDNISVLIKWYKLDGLSQYSAKCNFC